MSMISLQAVDAEFVGHGSNWPKAFEVLRKAGLVNGAHVFDAEALWHFGTMINNTDMHMGNLSLAIEGNVFRLLPIYDMCSMGFAPKSGGEIPPYTFIPKEPRGTLFAKESVAQIRAMARLFWENVSNDSRISDEFKRFLDRGNPIDLLEKV